MTKTIHINTIPYISKFCINTINSSHKTSTQYYAIHHSCIKVKFNPCGQVLSTCLGAEMAGRRQRWEGGRAEGGSRSACAACSCWDWGPECSCTVTCEAWNRSKNYILDTAHMCKRNFGPLARVIINLETIEHQLQSQNLCKHLDFLYHLAYNATLKPAFHNTKYLQSEVQRSYFAPKRTTQIRLCKTWFEEECILYKKRRCH